MLLQAGDKIRVSAGPHYEGRAADGTPFKTKMAERGVMIFEEYCELGASRWIVARGKAGFAALHIGPEEVSSEIPGLIRRPYKVTKVRMKDRPGGSARSGRQKKTRRKPVRQPAAQTQALPAAAPGLAICSDPRRE